VRVVLAVLHIGDVVHLLVESFALRGDAVVPDLRVALILPVVSELVLLLSHGLVVDLRLGLLIVLVGEGVVGTFFGNELLLGRSHCPLLDSLHADVTVGIVESVVGAD
jgi:hypothetical protein